MQQLLEFEWKHEMDFEKGTLKLWKGKSREELVGEFHKGSDLPDEVPPQFQRTLRILLEKA